MKYIEKKWGKFKNVTLVFLFIACIFEIMCLAVKYPEPAVLLLVIAAVIGIIVGIIHVVYYDDVDYY